MGSSQFRAKGPLRAVHNLKFHAPLLPVLLLHLLLAVAFSIVTPLGEAPDEPAHLSYARFIVREGRLPTDLAERQEAGYRAAWPPLYHFLIAGPLAAVGDAPPSRLKSVGDTPRRLIPTDGQTIAAFIHTADEAWPWRGLPLAWRLARLISVGLAALAVAVTYALAWQVTHRRGLALSAAGLHATIPQVLFIGSVVNDDNLLILLAGLLLLALVTCSQRAGLPAIRRVFWLGALLGLASVAKYNALPLWPLTVVWAGWLVCRQPAACRPGPLLTRGLALLGGALLTGGWWFGFVWLNFNQIDAQGWWRGSLAALGAGAADASLRQVGAGSSLTLPPPALWLDWFITLFKSFWGLFGGGGAIELAGWLYWLLAVVCFLAIAPYFIWVGSRVRCYVSRIYLPASPALSSFILHPSSFIPILLTPFFFLLLPLLRFALTGQIVETAQGRHLFPALPAIVLLLTLGLSRLTHPASRPSPLSAPSLLFLITTALSLYSLTRLQASYPPPIPLHTTADALAVERRLDLELSGEITLVGYELSRGDAGMLPVTLVWQAETTSTEDYRLHLTLTDPSGQAIGDWLGEPVGGRYPSRAWDKGDILRHTVLLPFIPDSPVPQATLTLQLLDSTNEPTAAPLVLFANLPLPAAPRFPRFPAQLRADGLPPGDPFTYRSTLSFVLSDPTPPQLLAPDGQTFAPVTSITNSNGAIAHFIVGADWPGGNYQLSMNNEQLSIPISNRARRFTPPLMAYRLEANFAGQVTLLGYDLPQRRVRPGDSFPITLYLRGERTMGQNLVIFNHLLDRQAVQRGGGDRVPLDYYTTLLWAPGEIVSDSYRVPVESTAPPGVYWLDVGLYPSDQPHRSLPLVVNGQPIDRTSVRLIPVKVGGPPPEVTVTQANPQRLLDLPFGNQITLLGFDFTGAHDETISAENALEIRKSKIVNLKLYWRPTAIPPADYTVFVHLLDPAGSLVTQADSPPASGGYPTSLWDPGEIIVDTHPLPALPPGRYILQVGLYRPDMGERLPLAGSPDGAAQLIEVEVGE
ncbi:MAG: hypothetical protein AB1801_06255 [Chloroflexota bacterium]